MTNTALVVIFSGMCANVGITLTFLRAAQTWAAKMVESVKNVDVYMGFFCDYILQLSRRKYGGLSALCRIMPNALPITSDYTSWTLNDCVVTGIKQRPCFEIMSGKHGETSSFVHHAEIQCCQSIWTIMHMQQVLACAVGCFKEHHTDTNLTQTIEAFEVSAERQTLMDYCSYVFEDVRQIFVEDNILQNNTDVERVATGVDDEEQPAKARLVDDDKRKADDSEQQPDDTERRVKPRLA